MALLPLFMKVPNNKSSLHRVKILEFSLFAFWFCSHLIFLCQEQVHSLSHDRDTKNVSSLTAKALIEI